MHRATRSEYSPLQDRQQRCIVDELGAALYNAREVRFDEERLRSMHRQSLDVRLLVH